MIPTMVRIMIGTCLLISNMSFALPDDRLQILTFRANSADISQLTHHGTFLGNVALDQGSTHIRAAKAVTEGDSKNALDTAIITGDSTNQAHYWTLTSAEKPPLHAYADNMTLYQSQHRIELRGNARVEQGENVFSAPIIIYDTLNQHVISKPNGDTRTLIIIHPKRSS